MIPGNGIETTPCIIPIWHELSYQWFPATGLKQKINVLEAYAPQNFHINDSRQRDWNKTAKDICCSLIDFHINDSRQRDWNIKLTTITLFHSFFHINDSRQRDWNRAL